MSPPRPLSRARSAMRRALHASDRLDVASDFDGTLAPIAPRPDAVALPARARRALERLAALPGARLAILSGRSLRDLERTAGVRRAFYAGNAGIETGGRGARPRGPRGRLPRMPAALVLALRRWSEGFPGAWVETKGPALSVHDRAVAPDRRAAFGAGVRRIARPYARRVTVERGKRVHELRPTGAPDKARALERWLDDGGARGAAPRRALFYFGDDTNDQSALDWVRKRGGFAVAVGWRASRAEFRVRGPGDVVRALEWIAGVWADRRDGSRRPRPRRVSSRAPRRARARRPNPA